MADQKKSFREAAGLSDKQLSALQEIEQYIFARERIEIYPPIDQLSDEQIQHLIAATYDQFVYALRRWGPQALESMAERLQAIMDRLEEERDKVAAEEDKAGLTAGFWAQNLLGEDLLDESKRVERLGWVRDSQKLQGELAESRWKFRHTANYALFRYSLLRNVLHRFTLFGDDSLWGELPQGQRPRPDIPKLIKEYARKAKPLLETFTSVDSICDKLAHDHPGDLSSRTVYKWLCEKNPFYASDPSITALERFERLKKSIDRIISLTSTNGENEG